MGIKTAGRAARAAAGLTVLLAGVLFAGCETALLSNGVPDMREEKETATAAAAGASVTIGREKSYIAVGGSQLLPVETDAPGGAAAVMWSSSDQAVAVVDEAGLVTGVGSGTAIVTAEAEQGGLDHSVVVVTDCIVAADNREREWLSDDYFTPEEAELLDRIFFSRIADGGEPGTRGAVVAAARFLTLELPVTIPYFLESGRMDPNPGAVLCDGEGRYYHPGLYLDESKYDEIAVSIAGPAHWGAPLMNLLPEAGYIAGELYPNGLSCSGFICWALLNGGVDVGDVGSGDYLEYDTDLSDLSEQLPITPELLRSGDIRAGDLIGTDGHIAMIVGVDDTYISVAECFFDGAVTLRFTIERGEDGLIDYGGYSYIIKMDDHYSGDGNYTGVWY